MVKFSHLKSRSMVLLFFLVSVGVSCCLFTEIGFAVERTEVSGTVSYNGEPVIAMVLANGKYVFTGGEEKGVFELFDVPFDGNHEITLYAFCSGLSPFKTTLYEGTTDFHIALFKDDGEEPLVEIETYAADEIKPGWVNISGTIENRAGNPLCAMVLANGQYMFTCGDNPGEFNLTVPLDGNDEIMMYGFCSGLIPFQMTYLHVEDSEKDLPSSAFLLGSSLMCIGGFKRRAVSLFRFMRRSKS